MEENDSGKEIRKIDAGLYEIETGERIEEFLNFETNVSTSVDQYFPQLLKEKKKHDAKGKSSKSSTRPGSFRHFDPKPKKEKSKGSITPECYRLKIWRYEKNGGTVDKRRFEGRHRLKKFNTHTQYLPQNYE